MDLDLFAVVSQRFDRLERHSNLLQIQVDVLEKALLESCPEIAEHLEVMFATQVCAFVSTLASGLQDQYAQDVLDAETLLSNYNKPR